MRLTCRLFRNLNKEHWDRRPWENSYLGPLLPKRKGTGKPELAVNDNAVAILRERLKMEYQTMRYLASPYLTKEQEAPFIAEHGTPEEQRNKAFADSEYRRMPGEPKEISRWNQKSRTRANIGNLLHSHRTVEDSLSELIQRQRWD